MADRIAISLPGPMRFGVLSDTHVNDRGTRRIPDQVLELFDRFRVDGVLHAGDLNSLSVLETLETVAPVYAVHGNSDLPETRRTLPSRVFTAATCSTTPG